MAKQKKARFKREFVVSGRDVAPDSASNESFHEANKVAVLQEAINAGLHPKSAAVFVGSEDLADGVSVVFRYEVEVVDASEDADPAGTYTPGKAIDDRT